MLKRPFSDGTVGSLAVDYGFDVTREANDDTGALNFAFSALLNRVKQQ